MSNWTTEGAVIVTALATLAIAVLSGTTWGVYRQIKRVMEDSFQAELRPVVHVWRDHRRPEPRYINLGRGQEGWSWHLHLRNVGPGIAVALRLQRVDMETGERAELLDTEMNLIPDDKLEDEFEFGWPKDVKPSTVGLDVIYNDVYGNEFVTELRGKRRRFRRA